MNTDRLNHITHDRCELIAMQTANIKERAHLLIDKLPENVSWSGG